MKRVIGSSPIRSFSILLLGITFLQGCIFGRSKEKSAWFGYAGNGSSQKMEILPGMEFIPGGFYIANSGNEILGEVPRSQRKTLPALCMFAAPITNIEYGTALERMLYSEGQDLEAHQNTVDEDFPNDDISSVALQTGTQKASADKITETDIKELLPRNTVWEECNHPMADHYADHYFQFDTENNEYESGPYDDYPVIGITWEQATRFLEYTSKCINQERKSKGLSPLPALRLPTAEEFEYAARAGKSFAPYPWPGPYVRDATGTPRANVKIGIGEYVEEAPSPVYEYEPNNWGIYAYGNVYRWTNSPAKPRSADLRADTYQNEYDDNWKTIVGPSWASPAYRVGEARDIENKSRARNDIGLQPVMPYLGVAP